MPGATKVFDPSFSQQRSLCVSFWQFWSSEANNNTRTVLKLMPLSSKATNHKCNHQKTSDKSRLAEKLFPSKDTTPRHVTTPLEGGDIVRQTCLFLHSAIRLWDNRSPKVKISLGTSCWGKGKAESWSQLKEELTWDSVSSSGHLAGPEARW